MAQYLDFERLEAIDVRDFQRQKPFPWANPEGLLTAEGFERLCRDLPELSLFEKKVGYRRKGGQEPHDRFSLEYDESLPIAESWQQFIAELRGDRYVGAMKRLLGVRKVKMRFHWHFAFDGCSVSPHCDGVREPGSHIFYFNTEKDWDPAWGGETLILDEGGRFDLRDAPTFADFDSVTAAKCMGNRSFLFGNHGRSWHGVREIRCPEDRFRKIFIVVFNRDNLYYRIRDPLKGKKVKTY